MSARGIGGYAIEIGSAASFLSTSLSPSSFANFAVCALRRFCSRLRNHQSPPVTSASTTRTRSRILHQGSWRFFFSSEPSVAADLAATVTRFSRQTPNPAMTTHPAGEVDVFSGAAHLPCRSFCPAGQERQEEELAPEQVAQLESHPTHFAFETSKYSLKGHVETHELVEVRTGRVGGQERHDDEAGPEQISQSG